MTTIHRLFPSIEVRDGRKPRRPRGHPNKHFEMFMDRAAGMTWAAIELKYNIAPKPGLRPGMTIRHRLMTCQTQRKLSPEQVEAIDWSVEN